MEHKTSKWMDRYVHRRIYSCYRVSPFQLHGLGATLGCNRIVIDLTQVNAIRGSIVTGKN